MTFRSSSVLLGGKGCEILILDPTKQSIAIHRSERIIVRQFGDRHPFNLGIKKVPVTDCDSDSKKNKGSHETHEIHEMKHE
jgi:hypothetical protein